MLNRSLLIVDDEPNTISSLKRQLRHESYSIYSANSGEEGLRILKENDVGVVLSDLKMPEMDGITFLENVKQIKPDVVRVLLTAHGTLENAMDGINRSQVFGYLTKPWSFEALNGTVEGAFQYYNLVQENKRLQRLTKEQNKQLNIVNENLENLVHERTLELEGAVREGVVMLALAAEAKDDDTGEHIYRIQRNTRDICAALGMSSEKTEKIAFFSIMHDIGKIHIPDSILQKPGPLSVEEWVIMQEHCIAGEKILGNKSFYRIAREIARSHHERWNGSGYPDGLKKDSIPLPARIVTIADIFDALTHERPYKQAWPFEEALAEMEMLSGKVFDPEILKAFFRIQSAKAKA
ncbi:MAG TPA: HD domain-containing phosphohydrolase [Anaerolineae bacterium]|nr:HD domain-containing phosphohydrolase [Anaerolineae bacterium]